MNILKFFFITLQKIFLFVTAYVSWVRFYASYPKDMRYIFDRKELHLGHYAKSFALRDPPQKIGGIGKTLRENNPSKPQHKNRLSNERYVYIYIYVYIVTIRSGINEGFMGGLVR